MLALRLQMGNIRAGDSRSRHLRKSLLMRFWLEKAAVSSPGRSRAALLQVKPQPLRLPSDPAPVFSPQLGIPPRHSEVRVWSLWRHTNGTFKKTHKPVVPSGEKAGGRDKIAVEDEEAQTTLYKINRLQGYIVQYREYSQYFIITINGT